MTLASVLTWFLVPVLAVLVYAFIWGSPSMRRYIVARMLLTIPMVVMLASLVFLIMRIIPGDPVSNELFTLASPEQRAEIRAQLGIGDPIYVQYGRFIHGVVTLDLGTSVTGARRPVDEELAERFAATFELMIPAALLSMGLGLAGGAVAAAHRSGPIDVGLRLYSVLAHSLPIFYLGLLFQLVFSLGLGWTPVAGRVDSTLAATAQIDSNFVLFHSIWSGQWQVSRSAALHLILPALSLGLIYAGHNLRLTRINVIEELHSDYIFAGRTRGITLSRLRYRYAFRNAFLPIMTLLGLEAAMLLSGTVITETVFSWPGLGRYTIERITARDYPAVEGAIVLFAIMVALISLVVDVLYAIVDPRVRL